MINAQINGNMNTCKIEVKGEVLEILSDTSLMINQIYNELLKQQPNAAELYRASLVALANSPDNPLFINFLPNSD